MKIFASLILLVAAILSGPIMATSGEAVKYRITKETPNPILSKDNLEIELNHKTNKETITKIANTLRSTRTQYSHLWIFYYLPNMKHGSGAWAISHFTPELDVEILGTSEKEDKKLEAATVRGKKILGRWIDNSPMAEMTLILFRDAGKPTMKLVFKDGSSTEEKLKVTKIHGMTKYQVIDNKFGEYYILEKNGNLGSYDSDGKIDEATKIK